MSSALLTPQNSPCRVLKQVHRRALRHVEGLDGEMTHNQYLILVMRYLEHHSSYLCFGSLPSLCGVQTHACHTHKYGKRFMKQQEAAGCPVNARFSRSEHILPHWGRGGRGRSSPREQSTKQQFVLSCNLQFRQGNVIWAAFDTLRLIGQQRLVLPMLNWYGCFLQ